MIVEATELDILMTLMAKSVFGTCRDMYDQPSRSSQIGCLTEMAKTSESSIPGHSEAAVLIGPTKLRDSSSDSGRCWRGLKTLGREPYISPYQRAPNLN